jgi:metal-responsive CopG/Arc/MetJ family transcriptional regulator
MSKERVTLTIDPDVLRRFDRLKTTKRKGRSSHVEDLMETAITNHRIADLALANDAKKQRKH